MISPVMKQAEYSIRILSSFDALKKRKMFEMNSKNKRFFDRRLIGYRITARFERISSNITASEKKRRSNKTCSVFEFKKKRIKRQKMVYPYS